MEARLEATKDLASAKTERDRDYYEQKCAAFDRQMHCSVYDFSVLTEEGIRIVEGTKP